MLRKQEQKHSLCESLTKSRDFKAIGGGAGRGVPQRGWRRLSRAAGWNGGKAALSSLSLAVPLLTAKCTLCRNPRGSRCLPGTRLVTLCLFQAPWELQPALRGPPQSGAEERAQATLLGCEDGRALRLVWALSAVRVEVAVVQVARGAGPRASRCRGAGCGCRVGSSAGR